uniref:Uncharacterized protein n=1 Tax=Zonotrichia albicollis TaxID=44394 RepID=A0A8D2MIK7_ZONAL
LCTLLSWCIGASPVPPAKELLQSRGDPACAEFPRNGSVQHCRISDQETNGKTSVASSNDFSDQIYKEIAITNGYINRMTREELRSKLTEFKLETRGVRDVLKKILKNYYKKQKLVQKEHISGDSCYDYICVVDFEATCEEGNPPEFVHEIIEFPVVLVNTHTLEIVGDLMAVPQLITSNFSDIFPQVLQNVIDYSMLTDAYVLMHKFLNIQCFISRTKYPSFAKKWINTHNYGNLYKVPRNQTKLTIMLENLGMSSDGSPHSGLDDSKNIARIAIRMLQGGCDLRVNERIHGGQLMTASSSGPLEGAPAPQMPRYRHWQIRALPRAALTHPLKIQSCSMGASASLSAGQNPKAPYLTISVEIKRSVEAVCSLKPITAISFCTGDFCEVDIWNPDKVLSF